MVSLHIAEPLRNDAAVLGLDINSHLIGLDHRNHIPLLHCLTHIDGPFHNCSLENYGQCVLDAPSKDAGLPTAFSPPEYSPR
jgi:hypothetical protein